MTVILWLFLAVSWIGLQCVIVVFPIHFSYKNVSYHNDSIKHFCDLETPFCIPVSLSIIYTQYSFSPIVFSSLDQLMQIIINIKFVPDYFDTYGNS